MPAITSPPCPRRWLALSLAFAACLLAAGCARAAPSVSTVVDGLEHPWGLAALPEGGWLVTERVGRLRRVDADGQLSAPIAGVPEVEAVGQGGLLDIALSPQFADDHRVYFSYAEPGAHGRSGTAVARAVLDGDRLRDLQVIFRQQPKLDSDRHYGSRLAFDDRGHLFVTLGERGRNAGAQQLANHLGTIVRIFPDGSIPPDNPFVDGPPPGQREAEPAIWSYGHRNVQGAAFDPRQHRLWISEQGPKGGDEINRPQPGHNYGWPRQTHGIDYNGKPIPQATTEKLPGMDEPVFWWPVSPAVSGIAFYDDARHPQWRRSLFVAALAGRAVIRLTVDDDGQLHEAERLLGDRGWRFRDVEVGSDGALYVLTDENDGALLRVVPDD